MLFLFSISAPALPDPATTITAIRIDGPGIWDFLRFFGIDSLIFPS